MIEFITKNFGLLTTSAVAVWALIGIALSIAIVFVGKKYMADKDAEITNLRIIIKEKDDELEALTKSINEAYLALLKEYHGRQRDSGD